MSEGLSVSNRHSLRAKESGVFRVRAKSCAKLNSHRCAALDESEVGEVSGVILAAARLPAGDGDNGSSICCSWSGGRCGYSGVRVDLRSKRADEEGQVSNGTYGAGAEGGMHFGDIWKRASEWIE